MRGVCIAYAWRMPTHALIRCVSGGCVLLGRPLIHTLIRYACAHTLCVWQVVSYFVDLLYDKNAEIRKMADQTLDLVLLILPEISSSSNLRY
jgi:hypothetical protein